MSGRESREIFKQRERQKHGEKIDRKMQFKVKYPNDDEGIYGVQLRDIITANKLNCE